MPTQIASRKMREMTPIAQPPVRSEEVRLDT